MEKQSLFIESQTVHMVKIKSSNMWYILGQRYAILLMKPIVSTMQRQCKVTTSLRMADILLKVDILLKSVQGFSVALDRLSDAVRHILRYSQTLDQCTL
jgi:hypothetical protein